MSRNSLKILPEGTLSTAARSTFQPTSEKRHPIPNGPHRPREKRHVEVIQRNTGQQQPQAHGRPQIRPLTHWAVVVPIVGVAVVLVVVGLVGGRVVLAAGGRWRRRA